MQCEFRFAVRFIAALLVIVSAAFWARPSRTESFRPPTTQGEVDDEEQEDPAEQPAGDELPRQLDRRTLDDAEEIIAPEKLAESVDAEGIDTAVESAADDDDDKPIAKPLTRVDLPALDATSLKGVMPGRTTRKELHKRWGQPEKVERTSNPERETYHLDRLGTIRVFIRENIVESLSVHIQKPAAAETLAKRLELDDIEPVDIHDESGQPLGQAYPEHGVLFGYAPGSDPPRVFQVVIEQIDAETFLARAEVRLVDRYADCLADLQRAIELRPDSGKAQGLYAELTRRAGELTVALEAAQRAVAASPEDGELHLTLARVLADRGENGKALKEAKKLAEGKQTPAILKAKAYCQWGDCVASGTAPDYAQAIKLHQKAIDIAKPLAADKNPGLCRAAKELLVDAHLAVANDIGWGRWQQKETTVPKWLDKAAAIADDLAASEDGADLLRLRVYQRALHALAGITDPPEANKWIKKVSELGARTIEDAQDSTYRARLAWQLGEALAAAVEIESARERPDRAIELGDLTQAYFEQGEAVGSQLPVCNAVRGRLCYRMGAIWAIQREDHEQALEWYDRAVPLLENLDAKSPSVDLARQGEIFVSMAVSYWEMKNRPEALRLTEEGVKWMEDAVDEGQLAKQSLAIPYANLASMHQQLGNAKQARQYSERAARWEEPTKKK